MAWCGHTRCATRSRRRIATWSASSAMRLSRGGSSHVHEQLKVGQVLAISGPRNHFTLHEGARHSVLIAGGIGVTPIACMTQRLRAIGASFEVHLSVRRREEAAFLDVLAGPELHLHVDAEHGNAPLPLAQIVAARPPDAHLLLLRPRPHARCLRGRHDPTACRPCAPGTLRGGGAGCYRGRLHGRSLPGRPQPVRRPGLHHPRHAARQRRCRAGVVRTRHLRQL